MPEIIVALNTNDLDIAENWASLLHKETKYFKIGLPLIFRYGTGCISKISEYGKLFIDLKLHDIPSVLTQALETIPEEDIEFVSVHATSGPASMRAVSDWAKQKNIKSLAVTVLTSIDEPSSEHMFNRKVTNTVLILAEMALNSGVNGIVCSGNEVDLIRKRFGNDVIIVTPGFRLEDTETHDQSRIITPEDPAIRSVDYVVIGRTITNAPDPLGMIKKIKGLLTR